MRRSAAGEQGVQRSRMRTGVSGAATDTIQLDFQGAYQSLTRISHTHGPQCTPRRGNLVTAMAVTRDAPGVIAVTGCGWGHRPPTGCREKQPRPDEESADEPERA